MVNNYNFEGCMDNFYPQACCILCLKLPSWDNKNFNEIVALKNQIIENKINHNDFNFSGANLLDLELKDIMINGDLNLDKTVILGRVILNNITVTGDVNFSYAKIKEEVRIIGKSNINQIHLNKIYINGSFHVTDSKVSFLSADGDYKNYSYPFSYNRWHMELYKIKRYILSIFKKDYNDIKEEYLIKNGFYITNSNVGIISVSRLNIGGPNRNGIFIELVEIPVYVYFIDCNIEGSVWIRRVTVEWDCNFGGSRIKSSFDIELSEIKGKFDVDGVIFISSYAQEGANREAKRIWDKLGDKDKTDKYYYKEMEAKRLHKKFYYKYPELLVQYCFGYGVYPFRVIFTTLFIALFFAWIFWAGNGLIGANSPQAYIYFSFINALKLGSLEFKPASSNYQLLATIEAIIGTFLWAAFVATFARKFMR